MKPVTELLQGALDNPRTATPDYWTTNPSAIEGMIGPGGILRGYLITHETDDIEICLVTCARRAFVRQKQTGATLHKTIDTSLCRIVEACITTQSREPITV